MSLSSSGNVITGANGRLDVYVSKAKDLPNLRKLDKQDPFVKLRIAHLTEISPVIYRGGQTPKFDFHCVFQLTPDMKPLLSVELYDDHDHKHGSRLIGKCEVDLLPALLSDPEEGHDQWYYLNKGSIEAGKVYIELTFVPNAISESRNIEVSNMDFSIQSRTVPPLPSDPPEFHDQYNMATSSLGQRTGSSLVPGGYVHGSHMRSRSPVVSSHSVARASSYYPGDQQRVQVQEPADFDVSMGSNATTDTYHSQQTQSTEGLMDKLKLIKEKLNYFKNGSSDPSNESVANNAMDLEVLQKVVGAGMESSSTSRVPSHINVPSSVAKNFQEPPLPPIPTSANRTPSRTSVRDSSTRSPFRPPVSPRLPDLPTNYSPASSRHGPPSPTRRRPPPM